MKQHIEHVESGQFSLSSYLGNVIQNELIVSISGKMLGTVVTEIKQSNSPVHIIQSFRTVLLMLATKSRCQSP